MQFQNFHPIRIIAGKWRNRIICSHLIKGVRPTIHRMRQRVFDILYSLNIEPISHLRVLDLCAGTGAYGFEALSRGASHVQFIDANFQVLQHILQRLRDFNVNVPNDATVTQWTWPTPLIDCLQPPFHVIFFDPPYAYAQHMIPHILDMICSNNILHAHGTLIIEHPCHLIQKLTHLLHQHLKVQRTLRAGKVTSVSFLQKIDRATLIV